MAVMFHVKQWHRRTLTGIDLSPGRAPGQEGMSVSRETWMIEVHESSSLHCRPVLSTGACDSCPRRALPLGADNSTPLHSPWGCYRHDVGESIPKQSGVEGC